MFLAVLTIMVAPVTVEANMPVTLEPISGIEFINTTEKNTLADCNRVLKALTTSKKIAFCSPVVAYEAPVVSVTPASVAQ
jgi:hypothetical protein